MARVLYLGGKHEVFDVGIVKMRAKRPLLQISGRSGFFRDAQNNEVIADISDY